MTDSASGDQMQTRPEPHMLNVQFGAQWGFVTPCVYRYEDAQWIDEFFATGRLRLGTFAKFATYPDEVRGDAHEGSGMGFGATDGGKSVFVAASQGSNAAVLCCSHRLGQDLRRAFQRDSAFEITNTLGFCAQIARQLPGFRGGFEGSCIYRSSTTIQRSIDFDEERYRLPDGNFDMQMIADAGAKLGGPERMLLKKNSYQKQQEYRMLWFLDVIDSEHVDVIAPQAVQFCRRIESADWSE